MKHHSYGSLEKAKFIGHTVLEDELIHDYHCMEHGSRQAGMMLEP